VNSGMTNDNPYASPRSTADPQPAKSGFRWRILPTILCGLYAVAFGYAAIDQVLASVRLPMYRDVYFASIIGARLVVAIAWTLATRFWWRAQWWAAAFFTVGAILLMFLASKLKLLG